jgi:thiamine biosynthesis lipoprotein
MPRTVDFTNGTLHQFLFRAMNTNMEIVVWCRERDIPDIETFTRGWFSSAEQRFSRFRGDSELSHLNRLAGERCMVSDAMLEVLLLAETYRQSTGGAFDPLILNALRQAGYDDSFEIVKARNEDYNAGNAPARNEPRNIVIDPGMQSVQLPPHSEMDLGGIVKSWAVKRLADYFRERLQLKRGLINAGGDLTVWGTSSGAVHPWLIGIENPWKPDEDIGMLALTEGALATSGKLGRQWRTNRGPMHHLIDPRTMRPSESDVVQCTVTGKNVVECEIWAKTICILGSDEGLSLFARKAGPYEALVFTVRKQTHFFGNKESLGSLWRGVNIDHVHDADTGGV